MHLKTQDWYSIYGVQHAQTAASTDQKVIGRLVIRPSLILVPLPISPSVRCLWQIIHGYGAPIGEDLLPIRREIRPLLFSA